MPAATVDASEIRFPAICARCGGAPETTHEIDARRGVDLIFIHYQEFIDLPVPLCRRCKRYRRTVGIAAGTGSIVLILGGGLLGMVLAEKGWSPAVAALGIAIGAIAIFGRLWQDDLVEWSTVGLRVVWRKGPGIPLMVRFRHAEYFAAWTAVNPSASVVP